MSCIQLKRNRFKSPCYTFLRSYSIVTVSFAGEGVDEKLPSSLRWLALSLSSKTMIAPTVAVVPTPTSRISAIIYILLTETRLRSSYGSTIVTVIVSGLTIRLASSSCI